ncbi:signal recognition particle-docking protein FtsY [Stenotrophomonas rhizophila]|uniref:signal recognition particle-docking protein FtsY n=1 Tax=Stenotrophomonas rhizophila TaxID=216778 RepID=UPI002A6994F3|nr:signal recognition particle-docking protein FtsY [Stenotrophomonas rhizophila]MDY0953298.1 signal recognition particle-docking protein FtsY [Stenotrophomonas rhizophila]
MLSFFRRKKTQDAPQDAPKTQHYSAEELAAAFPQASQDGPSAPAPIEAPAAEVPAALVPTVETPAAEAPVAPPAAPLPPVVPVVPAATVAPAPVTPEAPVAAPAVVPVVVPDTAATVAPAVAAPTTPATPAPLVVAEPIAAPLPPPVLVANQITQEAAQPLATEPGEGTAAAAPGKLGWRDRLRNSVIARSFGGLFSRNPKLDDDLLDELETALITADVGVGATTALVEGLRKRMKAREFADANALLAALRSDLIAILQPVSKPLVIDRSAKPFVVLTVGVNGVGKTTTIGKLAKRFKDDGHSLMLAAGDTFRAAAVAQLQIWGERNGVTVVAQGQNADAASVAFDALQAGKARGTEVLIADTAGRLHTQGGLMNELGKIRRVLGKIDPAAPHEVLMVIDGTTGQNALSQLRQFHAAVNVTGLVVTKLDGTAKGGVVFALAREFGIPIRFAGIGERPEDLRVFDPEAFVDALLPEALGS